MRPTISVKIFSIALGLLVLMAIVTGLSGLNLRKVNNEVVALAAYYVPLEQRMGHIEIFSIALGLLVLMAIVTGLSGLNLRKVNNEVVALAAYYVPLEQRMGHI